MRDIKVVEKELDIARKNWFESKVDSDSKEAEILEKELRKLDSEYFSIVNQKLCKGTKKA
jgi:ribosome-binding ATPase YchF (GTP1/OBG family)